MLEPKRQQKNTGNTVRWITQVSAPPTHRKTSMDGRSDEVARHYGLRPEATRSTYLLEVLQVSEIFETLETVNEACDDPLGLELLALEPLGLVELLELLGLVELLELLGLVELLGLLELLGLELDDADDALCVPFTRTCWFTCLLRSSLSPVS
jgi:hypothetical protein